MESVLVLLTPHVVNSFTMAETYAAILEIINKGNEDDEDFSSAHSPARAQSL